MWWAAGWWWPGILLMAAFMVIAVLMMARMMRSMHGMGMCRLGRRPGSRSASIRGSGACSAGRVAFAADAEPAKVMRPGKRSLRHSAHAAESRAVVAAPPRDHRFHASAPQLPTVLVVVVATIGDHPVRSLARPPTFALDGPRIRAPALPRPTDF